MGAALPEFECVEHACEDSETARKFGKLKATCTAGLEGKICAANSDCDVLGVCTTEVRQIRIQGRGDADIVEIP